MITLAEIIRQHEADYRSRYSQQLPPERVTALSASTAAARWPRTCSPPARTALSGG